MKAHTFVQTCTYTCAYHTHTCTHICIPTPPTHRETHVYIQHMFTCTQTTHVHTQYMHPRTWPSISVVFQNSPLTASSLASKAFHDLAPACLFHPTPTEQPPRSLQARLAPTASALVKFLATWLCAGFAGPWAEASPRAGSHCAPSHLAQSPGDAQSVPVGSRGNEQARR